MLRFCVTTALLCFGLALGEDYLEFPTEFSFGTATSSYQVEGGWNASDKGVSSWDWYTHDNSSRYLAGSNQACGLGHKLEECDIGYWISNAPTQGEQQQPETNLDWYKHNAPKRILDGSTGDVACDSYHKWREDIKALRFLGVTHYRFSLSWTRILPTGYANVVSKDGVKYYNDLIDELLKYNITPMVTLYHWDHPQAFQEMGGFTNEVIVDLFGEYARVCFREFGDRVKKFITINEPESVCRLSYTKGIMAPGLILDKHAEYLCNHYVIKSHARAYRIYEKEFKPTQGGKIGFSVHMMGYYPKDPKDTESAEVAFQFRTGIFTHPIYSKEGDYPKVVKERIAANSKFENLTTSRLPEFTPEEIEYIKGSADWLGINHYTSLHVEPAPKSADTIYHNDDGVLYTFDDSRPATPNGWRMIPEGFRNVLKKVKEEYGNPIVYITENGIADKGTLEDDARLDYLYGYIEALLKAIKEDGCNIHGYTVWSLLDNFEWAFGYTQKFGLFNVDFHSPSRQRKAKKSAFWLKDIIRERKLLPKPAPLEQPQSDAPLNSEAGAYIL